MEIVQILAGEEKWKQWRDRLDFEKKHVHSAIIIKDSSHVVGQVICYHNPYHIIDGEQCLSVGNIKLPEEFELLQQVHKICVETANKIDAKHIISPINGSTWNDYRFVTEQLQKPFFLEPTTQAFLYNGFCELGYNKLAGYFSQMSDKIIDNWDRTINRYGEFIDMGVKFSGFDRAFAQKEFRSLAEFCNRAFRKNFLFSPIDEVDFVVKMSQVLPLINPDYTLIARNDGEVVGFIFAYHDQGNTDDKTIIVKTLARDIDGPYAGMGSVLSSLVMRKAISAGFKKSIHAMMIETNASVAISQKFNGKIISRYELLYYSV